MDKALATPSQTQLAEQSTQLCHPRIAPIQLDFSKPLSADELAVIAVLVNPDLKAMRAQKGVADAQVFSAGLLPDPQLALGVDHPTSNQTGLVNAYNFGLSWDVLGLLTRSDARKSAGAKRSQVRDDVAWREWMVANQTRQLAWRVGYLTEQESIAGDAATRAQQLLKTSRRNFERHDITIDALSVQETAYLSTNDKLLALRRELAKAKLDLNKNLGLPPAEQIAVAQPEPPPPMQLDVSALFDVARNQRLDLLALRAGYQAQEYQLQRDLLARYPQINLGLTSARDTGDVRTFGISAGISIPIFNGGRGAVAIARATRKQLRAEYEARLFQTRSDIATLVADIRAVDHEIEPLQQRLPQLRKAEATMRSALASGDVTALTYETVRSNLLTLRLQLASLEQSRAEQRVALQLATGAPWNAKETGCERQSS
jgi:cobalt-zinc-cadmium efflux system outer membrane protein